MNNITSEQSPPPLPYFPSIDSLTNQSNFTPTNQSNFYNNQTQPEIIDVDAEDTSPDITPLHKSKPVNHFYPNSQQTNNLIQPIPSINLQTQTLSRRREQESPQSSDTGESERKKLRVTPSDDNNSTPLDALPRRDDGTSIDSVNSFPSSSLKNDSIAQPTPSRGQSHITSDLIELSSDDDNTSPFRPLATTTKGSYQLTSTPQQGEEQPTPDEKTTPTMDAGRLVVSTGGGLFRMDNENNIQILDSDDEDEMTSQHRILNDGNGMIALASNAPTQPVPQISYTQQLMQNRIAAPSATIHEQNTSNVIGDLNFNEPQPDYSTSQPQASADASNAHMYSDVPLSSANQLQPQQQDMFLSAPVDHQQFSVNAQHVPNFPPFSNGHLPIDSQTNPSMNTSFDIQGNPMYSPNSNPETSQLLAQIDAALGLNSEMMSQPPLPSPNPAPVPFTPEPMSPVPQAPNTTSTTAADSVGEQGLSQNGLRNLLRQNELTADATVEAESPNELTVTLMPHQKRALAWMRKREQPTDTEEDLVAVDDECLGGILADDQGLGKTLSMIALVVSSARAADEEEKEDEVDSEETEDESDDDLIEIDENESSSPPRKSKKKPKQKRPRGQTLIVCPVSLINQWKAEFHTRIKPRYRPKVAIYHGPRRTKRVRDLEKYDIVITTYSILKNEFPKILTDHPEYQIRKEAKLQLPTRDPGPPFQIEWDRVVLDEAQYIKNRKTGSWKSAMAVRAKRRWCLTGTPIQNSVDDIYSLFCFIRYHFVPSVEVWNTRWKKKLEHHSAQVRENAFRRFQTVTGVVLLRRTKKDEINGKPLIELPPRILKIMERQFHDEEELKVYQAVQEKTVIQVNKFLLAGTLKTNYSSVLLLLLRLRQACSHPFLIQYTQLTGTKYLTAAGLLDAFDSPYSPEDLEEAMELIESGYNILESIEESNRERFEKMFEPQMKTKRHKKVIIKCDGCPERPSRTEFVITRCGHLFCKKCKRDCVRMNQCKQCFATLPDPEEEDPFYNGDDVQKEVHAKVILGDDSKQERNVSAADIRACMREELERRKRQGNGRNLPKQEQKQEPKPMGCSENDKGFDSYESLVKDVKLKREATKTENINADSKLTTKEGVVRAISQHSTKIRMVIDQLEETRRQDPIAKTIIFSQWTSMLDILDYHVQLNGHKARRLDGSMQLSLRQKQLEEFKSEEDINVMLISLHAGGTGLNLTEATNVILTDVWWNPSVEEQAIDRAHRIGQTKAVNVRRIKMTGTVEEKIYAICERKREIIDGSLGVTGAQSLGRRRLSVQELMEMFGSAAENVARTAQAGTAAAEAASNILRHAT